jgi:hypothetical protein
MKVIVEIPDKDASFAIKVLNSLAFVKSTELFSSDSSQLWENLKDAASEVKLHKKGKVKLKSAQQLLREL